jgi:hypothetical protein
MVMVACSSSPVSTTTNAADSTPPKPPPTDTIDPVLASLIDRADTIVVGRARSGAIRGGGQLMTIEVDRILAGSAGWGVTVITPVIAPPDDDALYFIVADPSGRGSALDDGTRIGFPVAWQADITARVKPPATATVTAATDATATELTTFRDARGKPWEPSQSPAVSAARRIVEQVPLVGLTAPEVTSILGEPDKQTGPSSGDERWEYVRHMGEVGAIFVVNLSKSRATSIDLLLTQ